MIVEVDVENEEFVFFWWNDWWKQNLAFVLFEVMDVRFSIT